MSWNPTMMNDDGSLTEGDDVVQETPPPKCYTVAVYLVDRAYGGPEEGGWYYDCGELSRYHWHHTRTFPASPEGKGAAREYRREVQAMLDATDNEGRREISSVLSEGKYYAEIHEDIPPNYYPQTRPHYE